MAWLPSLPFADSIKKRACRFLVNQYLGKFLEEKIQVNQLQVDVWDGKGTVKDVRLDVEALNSELENYHAPIQVKSGSIKRIVVNVPWKAVLKDSISLNLEGLELIVVLKNRQDAGGLASMAASYAQDPMATSLKIAEDCLKDDEETEENVPGKSFEGVELLARAIDSVVSKVKVSLSDARIRVEHERSGGDSGIAVELFLKRLEYSDITKQRGGGGDVEGSSAPDGLSDLGDETGMPSTAGAASFAVKQLDLSGVTLNLDEFSRLETFSMAAGPTTTARRYQRVSVESSADWNAFLGDGNDKTVTHPSQMALCSRDLRVTVKLKQAEVIGPKLDLECFLGSVHFFLTPIQLQLLLEFGKGLAAESSTSSSAAPPTSRSRPMARHDHEYVDRQRQAKREARRQFQREEEKRQQNRRADPWSVSTNSATFEETFKSVSSHQTSMSEEFFSLSVSKETEPSLPLLGQPPGDNWESVPIDSGGGGGGRRFYADGSVRSGGGGGSFQSVNDVPGTYGSSVDPESDAVDDDAQYSISLGTLTVTLLESNLRGSSLESPTQEAAAAFFRRLSAVLDDCDGAMTGVGRETLASMCQADHLRLSLSPFKLNAVMQKSAKCDFSHVDISIGNGELWESLYGDTQIVADVDGDELKPVGVAKLLTLAAPDDIESKQSASLKVSVKTTERLPGQSLSSGQHELRLPKTDVDISLGKVAVEINVTLVDRLSDVFETNPTPASMDQFSMNQAAKYSLYSSNPSASMAFNKVINDDVPVSATRHYALVCQCPFLLATVKFPRLDKLGPPQYRQSLRDQKLDLEFLDVKASTGGSTTDKSSDVEVKFKEMQGFYWMADSCEREHCITVTCAENEEDVKWPKVELTFQPTAAIRSELDGSPTPDDSPLTSIADEFVRKQPSPFSAKKVIYKDEQLLLPGSVQEVKDFETRVVARTVVDASLPLVKIHLPSKRFYEDIYNRICTDLLLWEPHVGKPVDPHLYGSNSGAAGFRLCQSNFQGYDDDDDITSEDDSFLSAKAELYTSSPAGAVKSSAKRKGKQSAFSLNVNVGRAQVTLMTSAGTSEDKPPSPEKLIHISSVKSKTDDRQGEILVDVDDLRLFTVTGYQGDDGLQYVVVRATKFGVRHAGVVDPLATKPVSAVGFSPSAASALLATIDRLESNRDDDDSPPMLSVAMKITSDVAANSQECQIAISVNQALIRHRMLPPEQTWITQIADFFAAVNDDVPGYVPPTTVTSLCFHLTDCVIDYRPKYLRWQAAVGIGSCSVSSNMVYKSTQTVFRVIVNTAELYLSEKQREGVINLKKNYVCVGDLESFDVLLKTREDPSRPYLLLEATNNRVDVRTCPDSCVALRDLLVYVASNADLDPALAMSLQQQGQSSSAAETTQKRPDNESEWLADDNPLEGSNPSLASALSERNATTTTTTDSSDDEDALIRSTTGSAFSSTTSRVTAADDDLLVDFDVVDLPGRKSAGQRSVAICNLEPDETFTIVEEHFSIPKGRSDLLNPPRGYPDSIVTYLLGDMTIVWHLYGGNDFAVTSTKKSSPPQTVRRAPRRASKNTNWKQKGGIARDETRLIELQLSKIRVRYDGYPSDGESDKATRLAALIGNIEIRDRLATSKIDKFLYQYVSEARPRQSRSNMVTVKLVVDKPSPDTGDTAIRLHVGVMPMRLNVDQDALTFIHDFYTQVSTAPPAICVSESWSPTRSETFPSPLQPVSVAGTPPSQSSSPDGTLVFTSFTFYPDLPIRVDYHGKSVDLEQGAVAGLAKVFGLLGVKDSEIVLKRLSCTKGLRGTASLLDYASSEWQSDIVTQWTEIVGGIGPLSSLKQLARGVVDLFWLPIEQYRKDGRIVRGLQKGASSFGTSTAMATVELVNRLLQTVQSAAEVAHDFVSPSNQAENRQASSDQKKRYGRQPADIRDGVSKAYDTVADGLSETAARIYQTAQIEGEKGGYTAAVAGVIRHLPGVAVQPFILATEATTNVLGGVRNHFNPDAKREADDKWRTERNG